PPHPETDLGGGPRPGPPQKRPPPPPPASRVSDSDPEAPGSPLIDQCSRHAIPPAITGGPASWRGHDLELGLSAQPGTVLTRQRLSDHPGLPTRPRRSIPISRTHCCQSPCPPGGTSNETSPGRGGVRQAKPGGGYKQPGPPRGSLGGRAGGL